MSMNNALLAHENNNEIISETKKQRTPILQSTQFNASISSSTSYTPMGKTANSSLNSSISNSVITNSSGSGSGSGSGVGNHLPHANFQQGHLPGKYMNSKRKHAKYNNMYSNMYPEQNNYLHLNSLWSIWYGVLLTLFQGYLAVHGAYRFLGCSLIAWKIEPVAELNTQIILSGLVFILLPFFFTSAVFKVGNLANDGIKLATGIKERRCSMSPDDGLEEESRGGTLRALWTHGGPTAAFIHIVIAMCLLLPRLLLEARIIENGLLPRDSVWQTELDFMSVNRRHLVALSVMSSSAHANNTGYDSDEDEDYFNDTMFSSYVSGSSSSSGSIKSITGTNSLLDANSRHQQYIGKGKNIILPAVGKNRFLEFSDIIDVVENQSAKSKYQGKEQANLRPASTTELPSAIINTQNAIIANTMMTMLKTTTTTTPTTTTTAAPPTTIPTIEPTTPITTTRATEITTTTVLPQLPITLLNPTRSHLTNQTIPTNVADTSSTPTEIIASEITRRNKVPSTSYIVPSTPPPLRASKDTLSFVGTSTESHSLGVFNKHQHHHHTKASRKHGGHHQRQRKLSNGSATHQRRHHQHSNRLGKARMTEESVEMAQKPSRFDEFDEFPPVHVYEHRPSSYEELDFGRARAAIYPKSSTTISTTTRDSNIHIVKPEKLPEIIPSTPVSSNSKIIEIKSKNIIRAKRQLSLPEESHVEIEPEYLIGDLNMNDSTEYVAEISTVDTSTPISSIVLEDDTVRLDGFAGMLQLFFGIEKPIDVNIFSNPPSAEFVNLVFALLVWCVRYPAVFWTTTKSFATIFSVQMIATASDIIFSFVGISNLYKLQIYSEAQPVHNAGLVLNATVTLALFLLSTSLMLSSSMIMYLYGHGRLAAKMRDRSIITLKSGETWIYFAHCASLCYVLALSVVKAPLLNDLSATYRHNLHCPTFMAALVSVMHILLWIIIWLCLTIKRRWSFKLPPLDAYSIIGKATTQPLLMHNRGSLTNTTTASLNNSTNLGGGNSNSSTAGDSSGEHKMNGDHPGNNMINAPSNDVLDSCGGGPAEDIYWPKLPPNSPKLKVTFNEVTSTCDDDLHHRTIDQQNDGKRHSPRGTSLCFTGVTGETDDGEYATLRSAGIAVANRVACGNSSSGSGIGIGSDNIPIKTRAPIVGGVNVMHLGEYEELPPPPQHMISSMTITSHTAAVNINSQKDYVNCLNNGGGGSGSGNASANASASSGHVAIVAGDDNISEEGKLLACVRDDSVTYASTRDIEPPLPPPPPPASVGDRASVAVADRAPQALPDVNRFPSSPEHLVSPLAPVMVTVHTNEAHITSSSTSRCLRRADSGVPQEALTPRSDTTSTGTESTTSPPERAPSESSSGVHSAEEREVEVVIRPRVGCKPPAKPPQPAIQEEPYGRCTNMRMSSFAVGPNSSSNTLPLQRSQNDQKFDYSQHCSTMPLPTSAHNHLQHSQQPQQTQSVVYATSAHCMTQSLNAPGSLSSFKTPLYANTGVAMAGHNNAQQYHREAPPPPLPQSPNLTHTTLPNGVRYSNPNILRRLPYVKNAESPYGHLGLGAGHHVFTKHSGYENSLLHSTIPEDRDSANYSMTSEQDCLYATANPLH